MGGNVAATQTHHVQLRQILWHLAAPVAAGAAHFLPSLKEGLFFGCGFCCTRGIRGAFFNWSSILATVPYRLSIKALLAIIVSHVSLKMTSRTGLEYPNRHVGSKNLLPYDDEATEGVCGEKEQSASGSSITKEVMETFK